MYGATKEQWNSLSWLSNDLLPVVSNPNAVISERSLMKSIGKTPSQYNSNRKVAGIPDWTSILASPDDINKWKQEPDYGICVQTRLIRGIDIDVNSSVEADDIRKVVEDYLGVVPRRFRNNSPKCLYAVVVQGEIPKRVIKTSSGIVELLANGQQFVAYGTHPTGSRYEWENNQNFVEISKEKLDSLWDTLELLFAVVATDGEKSLRKRGEDIEAVDHTIEHLDVLGWGRDGQAFITCPFKSDHTMDSGITETAYFPAGSNGYEQGHFKCLHAHCAERSDAEFIKALGIVEKSFDVVVERAGAVAPKELIRNNQGYIEPIIHNVVTALQNPNWLGVEFKRDTFRDEIIAISGGIGEIITDDTASELKLILERKAFKPVSFEMVNKCISLVASRNKFDSATEWLAGLEWDGVKRVGNFVHRYFGAVDSPYTRAVSNYMWSALAGRIICPGVKADMIPILQGEQGVYKSTSIEAISPFADSFGELSFDESDDNLSRKMRGLIVAEISELRGMHTKELESIKAFVSRTVDKWIPKFKEFAHSSPRRCLFFGTTNQGQFLADETGNRRFLPFQISRSDIDAIRRDRDLLWAEARALYASSGVTYKAAQDLAQNEHKDFVMVDTWCEPIIQWLYDKNIDDRAPAEKDFITAEEVMRGALGINVSSFRNADVKRVHRVLRILGFSPDKHPDKTKPIVVWSKSA